MQHMRRGVRVCSRGVGAVSGGGGRSESSAQAGGALVGALWERPLHASGSQSGRGKLWESPSAATFKHSAANKVGLSFALDGTLRSGEHDMKVFGLGFLRSVASREAHVHFTTAMLHWYQAMEEHFDALVEHRPDSRMARVWSAFGDDVRRSAALRADLAGLGLQPDSLPMSPASARYVTAIREAATEADGDLLLAHFYVRYFADLYGGSMLGKPTQWALFLDEVPAFYRFSERVTGAAGGSSSSRRDFIEAVYEKLNEVGAAMPEATHAAVVREAKLAFRHNAAVYTEQAERVPSMWVGAALGVARIVTGAVWVR